MVSSLAPAVQEETTSSPDSVVTSETPSVPIANKLVVGSRVNTIVSLASRPVAVVKANAWFATCERSESLIVSLMFVSAAARAELSQIGRPLAQNTVESMSTVAIRRGIVIEYIKELNKRTS
jgi:hypothetical protein